MTDISPIDLITADSLVTSALPESELANSELANSELANSESVETLSPSVILPESALLSGSTTPLFSSFFAGASFFAQPQPGGGLYAAGIEDTTNLLIFGDAAGGNDVAVGGDEVDIIMANEGDDNIMGAEGTDFIFGGLGDDIVRGGAGDDVVVGNEGSDVFVSGAGSDIYEFFADQFIAGDQDTILDFEAGKDALVVVGSTDVAYDSVSGLLLVDGAEVATLEAGLGLEVLTRADSSVVFSTDADLSGFDRSSSSAVISDLEGAGIAGLADESEGASGTDSLETSLAGSLASLMPGSTTPLFSSFFEGAQFFDSPEAGGGTFAAGIEDTTNFLLFGETNDVAVGGNEVDIIMGGAGGDNIMGAEGTDFMFGGLDDDIVRGGEGDDVIVGNEGSDVLIGGSGSDIYEFFADQFVAGDLDVVLDFELGQDSVVVVGSTDVSYDALSGLLAVDGTEVAALASGLDLTLNMRAGSAVLA